MVFVKLIILAEKVIIRSLDVDVIDDDTQAFDFMRFEFFGRPLERVSRGLPSPGNKDHSIYVGSHRDGIRYGQDRWRIEKHVIEVLFQRIDKIAIRSDPRSSTGFGGTGPALIK